MNSMRGTGLFATVTEIEVWRKARINASSMPTSIAGEHVRSAYQDVERIANAIAAARGLAQGPDHHYALADDGEILKSAALTPVARDVTKVNTMTELTCEKCGKTFKGVGGLGAHHSSIHARSAPRSQPAPHQPHVPGMDGLADPIRAKANEFRRRADELTAIADGYRAKVKELDDLAARAEKILNADSK